ncbi:unnamed protein product [Prorocentrum cordatum]|uniref:OPA3-like protein n=1 Tax=Prorocentrum cordatum TaxID=2364126 RepID=A0ABN9PA14_9DINO|nr:unnamed protein product [Polarella glacialis]
MVLAQLPVAKIFWLGVRQAARPISKVATSFAERSDGFQSCCVAVSRLVPSNRVSVPREEAVQSGCAILGEAVVFGVSGAVLAYEYVKQKEAERAKEDTLQRKASEERMALRWELRRLEERLHQQGEALEALRKVVDGKATPLTR